MAEYEVIEPSKRKHIRQPPSVPFLWEERPGVAKKDWQPVVSSVTTLFLPSPVKLIASVPFNWEEKPGKPLSCFSEPTPESETKLITLPSPPMYFYSHNHGDKDGIFDLDLESFSFETEDSFSSASSLLANCLASSLAVSAAVPVLNTSSAVDINDLLETPSSPASETDSNTSSYATGISSLAGSSFLECLFPLYPPSSGFLGKNAYSKKGPLTPTELENSNFDYESDCNAVAKRPQTLGELIMMSRRRSCQRKAVQRRKQNLSMEFINKKAFSCCIFGAAIKMIEGSQRKRHHLRLKLI